MADGNALRNVTSNADNALYIRDNTYLLRVCVKGADGAVRTVKPENLDNWALGYQDLFVVSPTSKVFDELSKLNNAGVTDRLILVVLAECLAGSEGKPQAYYPPSIAVQQLATLVARGVTTVDEYEVYKQQQKAVQQQADTETRGRRQPPRRGQGQERRSNVFLQRDKKDDSYYDHIFKKFDGGPSGGGEH